MDFTMFLICFGLLMTGAILGFPLGFLQGYLFKSIKKSDVNFKRKRQEIAIHSQIRQAGKIKL